MRRSSTQDLRSGITRRGVWGLRLTAHASHAEGPANGQEIHGYKTWDILEALQPDPTRLDAQQGITSYASLYHKPGVPLFDMLLKGKTGADARMLLSWYAADWTNDPASPRVIRRHAPALGQRSFVHPGRVFEGLIWNSVRQGEPSLGHCGHPPLDVSRVTELDMNDAMMVSL